MKANYIKSIAMATCFGFGAIACTHILDEEPRAIFEPGFFETEQGVVGGITSFIQGIFNHIFTFALSLKGK